MWPLAKCSDQSLHSFIKPQDIQVALVQLISIEKDDTNDNESNENSIDNDVQMAFIIIDLA